MRFLTQFARTINSIFGKKNQQVTIRAKDIASPRTWTPDTKESVAAFENEVARLQKVPEPTPVPQQKIAVKQPWEIQLENMPLDTRYMLGKFLMAPSKDYTNMENLLTTYNTDEKLRAYLLTKPGIRKSKKVGMHYTMDSIMNDQEQ